MSKPAFSQPLAQEVGTAARRNPAARKLNKMGQLRVGHFAHPDGHYEITIKIPNCFKDDVHKRALRAIHRTLGWPAPSFSDEVCSNAAVNIEVGHSDKKLPFDK